MRFWHTVAVPLPMPAVTIDSAHPLPPPTKGSSVLAACLRRCTALGWRVAVTTPSESRLFAKGISRFWERRIEPVQHAQWSSAYRLFCGGRERAYDRSSWRILAIDRDRRVVGAITARVFCGEVRHEDLHVSQLLETAGSVFRDACEVALAERFAAAQAAGRTPIEISHWGVLSGPHAALLSLTLLRAMGALTAAFDRPVAIVTANHRRGEFKRLTRWGARPLGREGQYFLPPFVHRASGASLRILVVDTAQLGARGQEAAADLEVLRTTCPILSAP
jgi:hypothetical protein